LSGDLHQFADHRFLRGGVSIIELKRIGPAGEIRVATVCEQKITGFALDPSVVLRGASKVKFGALDKMLRMNLDPGMAQSHVIGDKVQHQLEIVLLEPLAQAGECGIAAKVRMDGVPSDGEARAGDVVVA